MRCSYRFCDRRVGFRRLCPAHRGWVDYLCWLRTYEIEQYRRRRYVMTDTPASDIPEPVTPRTEPGTNMPDRATRDALQLDARTEAVLTDYDRLVRESEDEDHPVRRTIVYDTNSAPFAKLVDVAIAHGWGREGELTGEELAMLRNGYAAYRQRLQIELLEEPEAR